MHISRRAGMLALALGAIAPAIAMANTSHAGWPEITGVMLMNKNDASRPLDARDGHDPFGGTDPSYSCDGVHSSTGCISVGARDVTSRVPLPAQPVSVPQAPTPRFTRIGHNELLGGHGNDQIWASDHGDVLWADYKPSGQPTSQVDVMHGGKGKDFFYASHGRNTITTGGGADVIHAHFGRGSITCDSPNVLVFLSRRSRKAYRLRGCRRISYKTTGY